MAYCDASREVSRRVAISVFGEKNPWRGFAGVELNKAMDVQSIVWPHHF